MFESLLKYAYKDTIFFQYGQIMLFVADHFKKDQMATLRQRLLLTINNNNY